MTVSVFDDFGLVKLFPSCAACAVFQLNRRDVRQRASATQTVSRFLPDPSPVEFAQTIPTDKIDVCPPWSQLFQAIANFAPLAFLRSLAPPVHGLDQWG
jgi:hypothetical protein